jgi:MFS transporter, MHS family, alpha-ketoglutarate permease
LVIFGSLIFATLLQPTYGALSDRIGGKPLLIFFGIAGTLATIPILTRAEGDEIAIGGLSADLRGLAFRRRLHLDQRHREGRTVSDQCPRTRRRPALRDHGLGLRRHRARRRAVLQKPRARGLVLTISQA